MYIGFILNGRNELEYCRILSSDVNDLDRRFGEFCFSQVRGQLKGAYLPEERIYCIKAAGEDGNRVESLVRDIIDRGAWPSDDYQRLRDIGFVHETADSYRRTDSRDFIVGELERTLHNGEGGQAAGSLPRLPPEPREGYRQPCTHGYTDRTRRAAL